MLACLIQCLRSTTSRVLKRIRKALWQASRPLPVFSGLLRDVPRLRHELLIENALLRQQLIVASRKVKRPAFKARERIFVVLFTSILPCWRETLLFVKPDTVTRWHREGFRLFWKLKSGNS